MKNMDHHSNQNTSGVLLVTVQGSSNSGSVSSPFLTPSPSREIRGLRLFRAISRKLGRRSQEDLSCDTGEDDSRSSSTDSCSSTSTGRCSRKNNKNTENHHLSSRTSNLEDYHNISPNHLSTSSSSTSDSGSDTQDSKSSSSIRHRHHHSTTAAVSFRKVFQHLTLQHNNQQRSQSCENTKEHCCTENDTSNNNSSSKRSSKKNVPKRILRPPITYTYVRGMSGLPTQRVPRSTHRVYNRTSSNGCYCGHQYSTNLTTRY